MKIVTKYLLREILGPFFFGLLAFSGMFLGFALINVIQWADAYNVPFFTVLKLWSYHFPENIAYGAYIGMLLATLLGLGRMTGHSETIAMQAGGVSFIQIATPVLITGLVVSVATFFFNEALTPMGKMAYRKERAYLASNKPKGIIKNHFFTEYGKNGVKRLVYAEEYYIAEERFHNVMIQEVKGEKLIRTIKTKELLWGKDSWYFHEGELFYYKEDSVVPIRVAEGNNPSGLENTPKQVSILAQKPEEMSWSELRWYLKNTNLNKKTRNRLEVQFHLKLAMPFASFLFALLGTPLALQSQRRTSSTGLGLCIVYVIIYYLLMALGSFLGHSGTVPPFIGAWFQNIIVGLFGGYMFLRKALYLG